MSLEVPAAASGAYWIALGLFVVTYAIVMSERINRAVIALLGAGLMVALRVLEQTEAVRAVDLNTLGLLAGMMVVVHVTGKTGLFEFLAIWTAKRVRARPWPLLLALAAITALCSALLDNVTTVMLVMPVTMQIVRTLGVPLFPYLVSTIFASNVGGTATLIGDPPNILIGSRVGLSFNDFLIHTAPACLAVFAVTWLLIYLIWGRRLRGEDWARQAVLAMDERETIRDFPLLIKCLVVIGLAVVGFVLARVLRMEPATIAMTAAALCLVLEGWGRSPDVQAEQAREAFGAIEWTTLFFFVGLFVIVAGVERVGIMRQLADALLHSTGADRATAGYAILWGSAVLSAVVDNIPFVAAMIPLIQEAAPSLGGTEAVGPLWYALSLGACLGGNGTLIGASANLVVAGFAEKHGHPLRFVRYSLVAFPLMLVEIGVCHVYLWLRYFSGMG